MRRPLGLAFAVALLVAALASVPLPVDAHSNHLTVGSQVSADGTVVVETLFVSQRAHLVVHADDGGEPGEALGERTVVPGGLQRNVEVAVDDDRWAEWGDHRTVWVVLHADDGDGEYDGDEPAFAGQFGGLAGERVAVGKGDAALVTGRGENGQVVDEPRVSVGRVTLPADGTVVLRDEESDAVVGTRTLAAGTHEDVAVAVDESFVESRSFFEVRVHLYAGEVDGTPSASAEPLRAGDRPVETLLPVDVAREASDGDSAGATTLTPPRVNTPVETTTPGAASPSTDGANATADAATVDAATTDSSASGPGFGAVWPIVAAGALTAVWFVRRIGR